MRAPDPSHTDKKNTFEDPAYTQDDATSQASDDSEPTAMAFGDMQHLINDLNTSNDKRTEAWKEATRWREALREILYLFLPLYIKTKHTNQEINANMPFDRTDDLRLQVRAAMGGDWKEAAKATVWRVCL